MLGQVIERDVAAYQRRTAPDAGAVRDAVRDTGVVAGELNG
jgi:hypothetical protein